MLALMVQNHPHRTGPDLRREFVRRLACHGSTFSRVGASGNPGAVHTGTLYGFNVSQYSAYDSQYLMKVGLAVTAQHGAFTVKAAVNAVHAAEASYGINAQLSIGYKF